MDGKSIVHVHFADLLSTSTRQPYQSRANAKSCCASIEYWCHSDIQLSNLCFTLAFGWYENHQAKLLLRTDSDSPELFCFHAEFHMKNSAHK